MSMTLTPPKRVGDRVRSQAKKNMAGCEQKFYIPILLADEVNIGMFKSLVHSPPKKQVV